MKKVLMRVIYAFITVSIMILGIASRKFSYLLPKFLANYAGDVLWALMVFFGFRFILIKKSTYFVGIVAISFSYLIEISQLYHKPWIDAIRRTALGGLVLGYGFLWSDILCYTIGVAIGIILDKIIRKFNIN
ncbi:DUF2809 domain-containing protein [Clostridium simiarum]|nr:DUF2809 domain-containing protein [Clostridium simiarum]